MDQPGYLPYPKGFATKAIHSGQDPEKWDTKAVVPPLVMSTTFKLKSSKPAKYEYSRTENPTRDTLEACLKSLEGAKYAICFSAGVAAINAVLGTLKTGDHIVTSVDMYGGSHQLFKTIGVNQGLEFTFVAKTNIANLEAAIKPNTKMIWMETVTNPCLQVTDLCAVSALAKSYELIFAVDNTFMTPYLLRPLDFGVDLSVYSMTKYMNGHTDVIMGSIMTNNDYLHKRLSHIQKTTGAIPAPFDCALVIRGLKTLPLRMRHHSANGLAVAKYLETHPKIEKVIYPGLPSHPQYELFKTLASGPSGMVSFYIKGSLEDSEKLLRALKVMTWAGSLGGSESVGEIPILMSHASIPLDEQKVVGIYDNMIRISVGLEDIDDLLLDLKQALSQI